MAIGYPETIMTKAALSSIRKILDMLDRIVIGEHSGRILVFKPGEIELKVHASLPGNLSP